MTITGILGECPIMVGIDGLGDPFHFGASGELYKNSTKKRNKSANPPLKILI